MYIAWSTLYFEVPALSDPNKYRRWLYEALWLGELSDEMKAEIEQAEEEAERDKARRVREGIGKSKAPASALAELKRVTEMREARRRELEEAEG